MGQMRDVSSPYGAPMGRPTLTETSGAIPGKCRLFRVRLNSGGYDDGGAYWGFSSPLYCCDGDGFTDYCRADDRDHAKDIMAHRHPGITFYR